MENRSGETNRRKFFKPKGKTYNVLRVVWQRITGLFNFEGAEAAKVVLGTSQESIRKDGPSPFTRGCSSAGRAPALHAGGQEFDPPHLHQKGIRKKRTCR